MKTFLMNQKFDLNENNRSDERAGLYDSRLLVQWSYDIANGMKYLSEKNIMHGDLSAKNILIAGKPYCHLYINNINKNLLLNS